MCVCVCVCVWLEPVWLCIWLYGCVWFAAVAVRVAVCGACVSGVAAALKEMNYRTEE